MVDLQIYNTPYPLALSICQRIAKNQTEDRPIKTILEPGIGSGNLLKAIDQSFQNKQITGILYKDYGDSEHPFLQDLQDVGGNQIIIRKVDFLLNNRIIDYSKYDLIIANPPFNNWEQHLLKAYLLLNAGGSMYFILRLNILGSNPKLKPFLTLDNCDDEGSLPFYNSIETRQQLLNFINPKEIWPIYPRPNFLNYLNEPILGKNGKPGTDANEYAVFKFTKCRDTLSYRFKKEYNSNNFVNGINWNRQG